MATPTTLASSNDTNSTSEPHGHDHHSQLRLIQTSNHSPETSLTAQLSPSSSGGGGGSSPPPLTTSTLSRKRGDISPIIWIEPTHNLFGTESVHHHMELDAMTRITSSASPSSSSPYLSSSPSSQTQTTHNIMRTNRGDSASNEWYLSVEPNNDVEVVEADHKTLPQVRKSAPRESISSDSDTTIAERAVRYSNRLAYWLLAAVVVLAFPVASLWAHLKFLQQLHLIDSTHLVTATILQASFDMISPPSSSSSSSSPPSDPSTTAAATVLNPSTTDNDHTQPGFATILNSAPSSAIFYPYITFQFNYSHSHAELNDSITILYTSKQVFPPHVSSYIYKPRTVELFNMFEVGATVPAYYSPSRDVAFLLPERCFDQSIQIVEGVSYGSSIFLFLLAVSFRKSVYYLVFVFLFFFV